MFAPEAAKNTSGNNRSGEKSSLIGVNSTMNSSVSSNTSGGTQPNQYKIQGQTVSSVPAKQLIKPAHTSAQPQQREDMMSIDPLRGMKGSYKVQDAKEKKSLAARMFGKK